MKAKAKSNPLKHFNDLNEARAKKFAKGGIFKTDGKTTTGVVSDYSKYPGAAPKPAKLVSPAMKKGGMVKSKKSC
jgi:hypothetical protein